MRQRPSRRRPLLFSFSQRLLPVCCLFLSPESTSVKFLWSALERKRERIERVRCEREKEKECFSSSFLARRRRRRKPTFWAPHATQKKNASVLLSPNRSPCSSSFGMKNYKSPCCTADFARKKPRQGATEVVATCLARGGGDPDSLPSLFSLPLAKPSACSLRPPRESELRCSLSPSKLSQ